MNFRVLLFFFSALVFVACHDATSSASTDQFITPLPDRTTVVLGVDEAKVPAHLTPAFYKVLQVHGSVEQWEAQESVSFKLLDFPTTKEATLSDHHRINLKSREHVIEDDAYRVVFDGEDTYAKPNLKRTVLPPSVYQDASFSIFGMPFLFGEEDCQVTDAGMAEIDGHLYKKFTVNMPDDAEDGIQQYQLYAYPDTEVLRFATWELTYPGLEDQGLRQLADFPSWQAKKGLLVPKVVRLYTTDGQFTANMEPDIFFYDEVVFKATPFTDAAFEIPADAVKDDSAK